MKISDMLWRYFFPIILAINISFLCKFLQPALISLQKMDFSFLLNCQATHFPNFYALSSLKCFAAQKYLPLDTVNHLSQVQSSTDLQGRDKMLPVSLSNHTKGHFYSSSQEVPHFHLRPPQPRLHCPYHYQHFGQRHSTSLQDIPNFPISSCLLLSPPSCFNL